MPLNPASVMTRRLFLLPDETLVFPGHQSDGRTVSTIAEERQHNPFYAHSRDAFAGLLQTAATHLSRQ